MSEDFKSYLQRCLSVDLEVDPSTASVFAFAAVTLDPSSPVVSAQRGGLSDGLDALEEALNTKDFIIGHNIRGHDLPHLAAHRKSFARAAAAHVDTLWLNPLAFPRNPYHHLVKHYHDGRLQAGHVNDPELDARLVFNVLSNQLETFAAMAQTAPHLLAIYHYLTTRDELGHGYDQLFTLVRRGQAAPDATQAKALVVQFLNGHACGAAIERLIAGLTHPRGAWPTAYALSWISVAGGDSVMAPWVRARFTEAANIVRDLRDTQCDDSSCDWCREHNDE